MGGFVRETWAVEYDLPDRKVNPLVFAAHRHEKHDAARLVSAGEIKRARRGRRATPAVTLIAASIHAAFRKRANSKQERE